MLHSILSSRRWKFTGLHTACSLNLRYNGKVQSRSMSVLFTELGIGGSKWPPLLGKCLYQQSARTPVDCQWTPRGGGTRQSVNIIEFPLNGLAVAAAAYLVAAAFVKENVKVADDCLQWNMRGVLECDSTINPWICLTTLQLWQTVKRGKRQNTPKILISKIS